MAEVERLVKRVVIMSSGRITADQSPFGLSGGCTKRMAG